MEQTSSATNQSLRYLVYWCNSRFPPSHHEKSLATGLAVPVVVSAVLSAQLCEAIAAKD